MDIQANAEGLVSMDQLTDEELEQKLRSWRRDPVLYCVERLGIKTSLGDEYVEGDELDVHQKRLLRELPKAIVTRKKIVVSSANAMGKDYSISGRASLWFYECFGPECKVVMTGPTERQVADIMWNELTSALERRPSQDEIGRLLDCYLDGGPEHFITAFTTKETEKAKGKFQGIHSGRLMIIVSEAQGVDDQIFEQIEGSTMAEILIVVFLGNPLTDFGAYARAIDDPEANTVVTLDAYDSINVKTGKQKIPGLVNKAWVDDKERKWNFDKSGDDPRYLARVRGKKPSSGIQVVVSKDLYYKSQDRMLSWWSATYGSIGVDPALTGEDDMVIACMISGELVDLDIIPYCEAPEAVARIGLMQKKHFEDGGCTIVIENDGLGGPIAQFYRRAVPKLAMPINVVDFRSAMTGKTVDPLYCNDRASAAFYAKDRMLQGHISLPDDVMLRDEATAEMYFKKRGKLQIEDKDDLKARLGRSPNRWDAVKLAIWGFKTATKIEKKDAWRDTRVNGGSSSMLPASGGSAMSA